MIDAEFLKVLACPYCVTRPVVGKSSLAPGTLSMVNDENAKLSGLKCADCGRTYPVDADGIPHLLVSSALQSKP